MKSQLSPGRTKKIPIGIRLCSLFYVFLFIYWIIVLFSVLNLLNLSDSEKLEIIKSGRFMQQYITKHIDTIAKFNGHVIFMFRALFFTEVIQKTLGLFFAIGVWGLKEGARKGMVYLSVFLSITGGWALLMNPSLINGFFWLCGVFIIFYLSNAKIQQYFN